MLVVWEWNIIIKKWVKREGFTRRRSALSGRNNDGHLNIKMVLVCMFKIKALTPDDSIKFWYVKSIKRGNKSFAGTTEISDVRTYRKTNSVKSFLDHLLRNNINYVLINADD